jgi:hypothetical protein
VHHRQQTAVDEAHVVEHRQPRDQHALAVVPPGVVHGGAVGEHVGLGDRDALGAGGRPGRVLQVGEVGRTEGRQPAFLPRWPGVVDGEPVDPGQFGRDTEVLLQRGDGGLAGDDDGGGAVPLDPGEPVQRPRVGDAWRRRGHGGDAREEAAEERDLEVGAAVVHEQGPLPSESAAGEFVGEPEGVRVQVAPGEDGGGAIEVEEPERGPLPRPRRVAGEQAGDGVGHPVTPRSPA